MNEDALVWEAISPRCENAHKGDFGTLTVVAGSFRYRGAAQLAVCGALRCGAGIVCLASIEEVVAAAAASIPECTYLPLQKAENGISISARSSSLVLRQSEVSDAMLIGCGMTVGADTASLVDVLLHEAKCPLVIDADALNVMAGDPSWLKETSSIPIITPHPGEMARLTGKPIAEILKDPTGEALAFAEQYRCITVLKGHHTVIASPDGQTICNNTGNAGLARGGSGDVLAGMIASFAAQGIEPFRAAVCGVYLHGLAADRCATRLSQTGMLPSDILKDLCAIFAEHGR